MVKAVGKNFLECCLSKLKYTKVYKVTKPTDLWESQCILATLNQLNDLLHKLLSKSSRRAQIMALLKWILCSLLLLYAETCSKYLGESTGDVFTCIGIKEV